MWIDYAENLFQYGKCSELFSSFLDKTDQMDKERNILIAYEVLLLLPVAVFMSFVVVSLTYRTMINLIDFLFRNNSPSTREELLESSQDSFCCPICNINDEHEVIYSKFDLNYVLNIFDSNKTYSYNKENENIEAVDLKNLNSELKYCKIVSNKVTRLRKMTDFIYKPDPFFRFTSRYINSILVAFIAFYYFVVTTGVIIIKSVTYATDFIRLLYQKNYSDALNALKFFLTTPQTIRFGDICTLFADYLCIDSLSDVEFTLPMLPNVNSSISKVNDTLNKLTSIDIPSSLEAIFIVPIFASFLICCVQMLLFMQESRLHLKQLYKGYRFSNFFHLL